MFVLQNTRQEAFELLDGGKSREEVVSILSEKYSLYNKEIVNIVATSPSSKNRRTLKALNKILIPLMCYWALVFVWLEIVAVLRQGFNGGVVLSALVHWPIPIITIIYAIEFKRYNGFN